MTEERAPTWFGQPRGLTILFLTNMWEQFSYFGMRALLVYYMTTTLLFDQEQASSIYGFYTAFAYFTPIIGGTIADRWLGKRKAVNIGAVALPMLLIDTSIGIRRPSARSPLPSTRLPMTSLSPWVR